MMETITIREKYFIHGLSPAFVIGTDNKCYYSNRWFDHLVIGKTYNVDIKVEKGENTKSDITRIKHVYGIFIDGKEWPNDDTAPRQTIQDGIAQITIREKYPASYGWAEIDPYAVIITDDGARLEIPYMVKTGFLTVDYTGIDQIFAALQIGKKYEVEIKSRQIIRVIKECTY